MPRRYGRQEKKFVFYDTDHTHAKLHIKFIQDGIKQSAFFKEFIKAYIEDDPLIRQWIEKNPICRISEVAKAKKRKEERKMAEENKNFNLDNNEVDEIFDILADELGD